MRIIDLTYWGGLKLFLLYTLYSRCWWGPVESKVGYLHITVAVRGPLKTGYLTHCSCYWGHLQNHGTYTLQLLLGVIWKRRV